MEIKENIKITSKKKLSRKTEIELKNIKGPRLDSEQCTIF